jgi:MYXO-CTERM domain-containing protein
MVTWSLLEAGNTVLLEKPIAETLTHGNLLSATLTNATLTNATLTNAKLHGAIGLPSGSSSQLTLTDTEAMIVGADITRAAFSYADLTGADFNRENDALDAVGWAEATWTGASFHYLNPGDFPTGMIHADHGITVRTPEPGAILLALLGLALLPRRRRR